MLDKIFIQKQLISEIKEDRFFVFQQLTAEQKARSLTLLETILRNLSVLDNEINKYLKKKTNFKIINILRISFAEILLEKIAVHAAVDCAVRLAKLDRKLIKFSGLINAVSRKASLTTYNRNNLGDPVLGESLLFELRKFYNLQTIKDFSLAQKQRPPIDLTIKNSCREKYFANLLDGQLLPSGTVRLNNKHQVTKLPGYEEGDWWVQDFSASIPVRLLGRIDGLSALDVCAAPGGKTLQLAALGAHVTSIEISKKRLLKLTDNLRRTSLSAKVVKDDFNKFNTKNNFDIVLVDAPCSATGTIRKNCDLQYLDPCKKINSLVKNQLQMVKKAMQHVKSGGRLVYCTCSLMPSEGENVIREVISYFKGWRQISIKGKNLGINPHWVDRFGGLRLQPDFWSSLGGMDGFYIAILVKER